MANLSSLSSSLVQYLRTRPFQVRVTTALILAMIIPFVLSNLLIYKFSARSSYESLRSRLKLIAQLAAEQVDPKILAAVPLQPEGIHSEAFQSISNKLNRIKQISPQLRYIYILTRTDRPSVLQFWVDPQPLERRGDRTITAYPGENYDAKLFPEMLKAFNGPAADQTMQADAWGVLLSGYAPIYDASGEAIAILGVDMDSSDVYQLQQEIWRRTLLVLIIGLAFCLFLGMLVSCRLTDPIEKLVEATRKVTEGNLNYQVTVDHPEDEISELSRALNGMIKSLKESRRKLLQYFYGIVRALVQALEAKDHYTHGHSREVALYAAKIAARMGFPRQTVKLFRRIALLHDIVKLGINDETLNKSTPLSPDEWDLIKKHPLIGEKILRPVLDSEEMLDVIRQHHERYDGNGYPNKLKEEKISIFASIVAVADAYSAMTSDRAYHKAISREAAIAELKNQSGRQFHPKVVAVFLEILEEERE